MAKTNAEIKRLMANAKIKRLMAKEKMTEKRMLKHARMFNAKRGVYQNKLDKYARTAHNLSAPHSDRVKANNQHKKLARKYMTYYNKNDKIMSKNIDELNSIRSQLGK